MRCIKLTGTTVISAGMTVFIFCKYNTLCKPVLICCVNTARFLLLYYFLIISYIGDVVTWNRLLCGEVLYAILFLESAFAACNMFFSSTFSIFI